MQPIRSRHSPPIIAGQACLVLYHGGSQDPTGVGQRFELCADDMILGRGIDADLVIDRDAVSRRHARLYRREGAWYVCDLQSTNGTYIDDQPVQDQPLRHGDRLKIGTAIFRFIAGDNLETAYFEEIHRLAMTDGLTLVHNRRSLLAILERELGRCGHFGRPLSLVALQIDHLKVLLDNHGQLVGDYILKELARRLQAHVRKEQALARYAGDAFAAVLPEVDKDGAAQVAEQFQKAVEDRSFDFDTEQIRVTVAMGTATTDKEMEPAAFLKMAEQRIKRSRDS